jgi:26S proteasome regulatory subunit N1
VLQIQKLLQACSEHLTEKAEHQALAVLGISLVAFGEQISTEMSLRMFDHLLQYSELPIKRAVPLALGFLYVSNPDYGVIDQLSRLSHDADADVALSAVFGLGLVSAGTNNSRVAQLLRSLSDFYAQDDNLLFCVRVAQGLNAMGKGLLTLHPKHSDGLLLRPASMAALLAVCVSALDMKETFLNKRYHYLLFALTPALSPRLLMALEKEDSALLPHRDLETEEDVEARRAVSLSDLTLSPIEVRVGSAVEVVGQAGKPRTITGFQTHVTPVQVSFGERAELEPILSSSGEKKKKKRGGASSSSSSSARKMKEERRGEEGGEEEVEREYESLTQVLEGVVVLRKRRKKTMRDLETEGGEEEGKEQNPNEA